MIRNKGLIAMLLIVMCCVTLSACSNTQTVEKNETLREINVGCINTGEYFYYKDELDSIARELTRQGMITGYDVEKERETTPEVWADLCATTSDVIHFIPEEYYDYLHSSESQHNASLFTDKVDLMLALGTDAAAFLTESADMVRYDYMALACADPISASIVKSKTERFNDKSFAVVDTRRMARQIDAAYQLFKFKTVGVVYENKPAAYSYSGIGQLEERAEKYGFKIKRIYVKESTGEEDDARYYGELKEAYEILKDQVDLLYITTATIADEMLPWLLSDVIDAGVITVAETSESQAEYGALMHITMSDAWEEGEFSAKSIVKYVQGTPITELDQVFEIAPKIILNQATIERTGVHLPMATYLSADKIYTEVKGVTPVEETGEEAA